MIKLENIGKTFKTNNESKEVLRGINFEIESGKITGFLGVNGSGKTTLIKTILQFISYNKGKVTYTGDLSDGKGGYQSIGYLPERPYYYSNLTGKEFLAFTIALSRDWSKEVLNECMKYAKRLSVDDALDRKLSQYSKGMLQKIGFISNLVSECKLLILDEPLSGLDLISREEYKKILKEYSARGGSVFISSHIVSDLEEVADKIVLIDSKEVRYNGSSLEFFQSFEVGEFELKYSTPEVLRISCPEDKLQEKIKEIEGSSHKIVSIVRKRKSFKDYIKDIRNEL